MNNSIRHKYNVTLAAISFLMLPLMAVATDNLLVNVKNGESTYKIEMSQQTKITFSNTVMNIAYPEGNISIYLADIDNMKFDLQANSEDEIDISLSGEVNFTVAARKVFVSAPSGEEISLLIYEISGRSVASVYGNGTVEFDFSNYAPGIYVIFCNGKTIKYLNH